MTGLATASLVVAALALTATMSTAAPTWKAPTTIKTVRGIPDPMVGIDRRGKATLVFSDASENPPFTKGPEYRIPRVYAAVRLPGFDFGPPTPLGDGVKPRVAVTPDGMLAVAWIDGDVIVVRLQSWPGSTDRTAVTRSIDAQGGAGDLGLALDAAGRATVVWASPQQPYGTMDVQLRAATVSATVPGGQIEELGAPGPCARLAVAGNLAGDTAALCTDRNRLYVRDPGSDSFADVLAPLGSRSAHLSVDGAGTVAVTAVGSKPVATSVLLRPRGGEFGPVRQFDGHVQLFAQENRMVAVRDQGGPRGRTLTYWARPSGGDFGSSRTLLTDARPDREDRRLIYAPADAPLGALPLLVLSQDLPSWSAERQASVPRYRAVSVGGDGSARLVGEPPVPGIVDFPGNVAGSEGGLAVATWEQRCGSGFAVMAMVLDERRGTTEPPCQDARAPKVAVRPQRARLAGRRLRVRIGCDEACRMVVRARVLRGGKGRPLATAKTRRAQPVGAGRYRSFSLRLTKRQAATVRAARAARRRVTVRLALSVRDGFENGAVRRVAVPLRG